MIDIIVILVIILIILILIRICFIITSIILDLTNKTYKSDLTNREYIYDTRNKRNKSQFKYPYFYHIFDVSGKRNVKIENLIDEFLNTGGFTIISIHQEQIIKWKEKCKRKIETSRFKELRQKQYENSIDDNNAYRFSIFRRSTQRTNNGNITFRYSYEWLYHRYKMLSRLAHHATMNDYFSQNQRKLMTKELRERIAKRDNYTCQMCGKYMPDGVGLHIDHIYPISKGGRSVPSNLQVLCSKCNGKKSNQTRTNRI